MSTPSGLSPNPPATQGDGRHPAPEPSTPRALGMLMARVPCSARDARRILPAAADLAGAPVDDLALAITTTPAGSLLPTRLERALRHAVEAARSTTGPDRRPVYVRTGGREPTAGSGYTALRGLVGARTAPAAIVSAVTAHGEDAGPTSRCFRQPLPLVGGAVAPRFDSTDLSSPPPPARAGHDPKHRTTLPCLNR